MSPTIFEQISHNLTEHGWGFIDGFLSQDNYQQIREEGLRLLTCKQLCAAGIGNGEHKTANSDIRRDQIKWVLEHAEETRFFSATLSALMSHLNQELWLSLSTVEAHFAYYAKGAFYRKHVDQFAQKKTRKISFVYYLNEQWQTLDGGLLTIYRTDNTIMAEVLPLANRLVYFRSDIPHAVTTTLKDRLSIAGWFKTRDLLPL